MRYTRDEYGPALMRFVFAELRARGESPTAFAARAGIAKAMPGKWAKGVQPSVDQVERVAEGLGRPTLELLAVMIGAEDEELPTVIERTAPSSIDVAIENDPTLSPKLRVSLRDIVASMRAFENGNDQ